MMIAQATLNKTLTHGKFIVCIGLMINSIVLSDMQKFHHNSEASMFILVHAALNLLEISLVSLFAFMWPVLRKDLFQVFNGFLI